MEVNYLIGKDPGAGKFEEQEEKAVWWGWEVVRTPQEDPEPVRPH